MDPIKFTYTETTMTNGDTSVHIKGVLGDREMNTCYIVFADADVSDEARAARRADAIDSIRRHLSQPPLRVVVPEQTDAARESRVLEGVKIVPDEPGEFTIPLTDTVALEALAASRGMTVDQMLAASKSQE